MHGLADCGYGFFARTGGSCYIAGLGIENMNIELMPTASNAMRVGGFVGLLGGTITGCYVKDSSIRVLNENLYGLGTGVFAGVTVSGGNVNNCYAYNSVLCGQGSVGCFSGRPENGGNSYTNCYVADITIDATGATNKVNAPSNIARFACEMNNGATVTNCYSNYALCTRTDFVKTVSTKEEIAAGIGASFISDPSVNNGYPCFSWELWDGVAATEFAGGTGTAADPYLISNPAQLKYANDLINGTDATYASKYYKLTADINYMNNDWIPLGRTDGRGFQGGFDGAGHVVKNVKITTPGPQYACNGFFADMGANTVITNLGIENLTMNIYTGLQTAYIGGFGGRLGGTITNCYIKNSSLVNTGNIAEWDAGAFGGSSWRNAKVTNCYAYNVSISTKAATPHGFVGKQDATSTYTNCYVADITFGKTTYGAFGRAANATAVNCYSTATSANTTDDLTSVTMGASKAAIVAGLATSGAEYLVNADKNSGYPSLKWETWNGEASASLAEQDGVYLINNAADLKKAAEMVNSGDATYIAASYKLTADVDYMNYEWTPIGLSGFSGKFNGNGHVVKNIKITTNNNLNGFFGDVSGGAVISNLGLENMTMDLRDGYWTGGFACRNYGTFENCYIANSTLKNTGGWAMGAFVGASANAGTYRNCYVYNVALNGKTEVSNFAGTVEGYSYFYTCYTAGVTSTNATTVYNLTNNPKAKPVTVNQCYSDVATTGTNAPVDATVADKAAMAAALPAFAENSIYKLNSKINNGYPSFTYQKAASYDEAYEVTLVGTVDGATKIRLETNEVVDGAKVYVATYEDSGRLIAAETLDPATIMTSTLSGDNLKVFVWDADCNKLALAKVINK